MTDTHASNAAGFANNAPPMGHSFDAAHQGHDSNPERADTAHDVQPDASLGRSVDPDAPSYERHAPPMERDFAAAHDGQDHSGPTSERDAFLAMRAREAGLASPEPERIATRAELDSRIAARARPEQSLNLTPGGATETSVHKQHDRDSEREIFLLQRKLESQRNEPTREFTRNR